MISFLVGTHGGMEPDGAITVVVLGVGYRVSVSDRDRDIINRKGQGGDVIVYCRTTASENEINVYGFLSSEDRQAFDRLLKVDGVGVQTALRLLSVHDAAALKAAVVERRSTVLTKIPGIGAKTAEKIIAQVRL